MLPLLVRRPGPFTTRYTIGGGLRAGVCLRFGFLYATESSCPFTDLRKITSPLTSARFVSREVPSSLCRKFDKKWTGGYGAEWVLSIVSRVSMMNLMFRNSQYIKVNIKVNIGR